MSNKIQALVTRGHQVKAQIKDLSAELKEIEEKVIEAGGGEDADGRKAQVVESAPTISTPDDIEGAQAIAGESFSKLFDVVKTHKPVKGFREVAKALLTKAKCAKLIALCEKQKAPWVKWS